MNKITFLLLSVFILSCSKNDLLKSHCTDPQAVNYNVDGTENDNACQYSVIGDWTVTKYTLSDGTNILSQFRYIDYTLYDDYTLEQEIGILNSTDYITYTGGFSLGGSNNSQLNFTLDGDSTSATITSITSTTLELNFDVDSSRIAILELIRI